MTKSFRFSRAIEMLIYRNIIKSEDELFGEVIPTLEMGGSENERERKQK